jgi:hypothetical protein
VIIARAGSVGHGAGTTSRRGVAYGLAGKNSARRFHLSLGVVVHEPRVAGQVLRRRRRHRNGNRVVVLTAGHDEFGSGAGDIFCLIAARCDFSMCV